MRLGVKVATMNILANTFMRAPGEAVGSFAIESALDELAYEMGMDPIELRMRNEPETDPSSGLPFSLREVEKAYRDGAERFGWSDRSATPGARREGEWSAVGAATPRQPTTRVLGRTGRASGARQSTARRGPGPAPVRASRTMAARLGARGAPRKLPTN